MNGYLSFASFVLALLSVGAILFKLFKAAARGVVSIDALINSVEANTKAQTDIAKAQTKTVRALERFRKATKQEISDVKVQIEDMDHRLDNYEEILSPKDIKKAS